MEELFVCAVIRRQPSNVLAGSRERGRGFERLGIREAHFAGTGYLAQTVVGAGRLGAGAAGGVCGFGGPAMRTGRGGSPYPAQPRRYVFPGRTIARSIPATAFSGASPAAIAQPTIAVFRTGTIAVVAMAFATAAKISRRDMPEAFEASPTTSPLGLEFRTRNANLFSRVALFSATSGAGKVRPRRRV